MEPFKHSHNRHFSHVTKSRIFKSLNLRKKADRNFRSTFLKNGFRHLNYIQITQADWPGAMVIWAPFARQKIEVHIIERANLSGFGTWKFTAKEDLNQRKQVFLLILNLGRLRNQHFGLFSMGKSLYKKTLYCEN